MIEASATRRFSTRCTRSARVHNRTGVLRGTHPACAADVECACNVGPDVLGETRVIRHKVIQRGAAPPVTGATAKLLIAGLQIEQPPQ